MLSEWSMLSQVCPWLRNFQSAQSNGFYNNSVKWYNTKLIKVLLIDILKILPEKNSWIFLPIWIIGFSPRSHSYHQVPVNQWQRVSFMRFTQWLTYQQGNNSFWRKDCKSRYIIFPFLLVISITIVHSFRFVFTQI